MRLRWQPDQSPAASLPSRSGGGDSGPGLPGSAHRHASVADRSRSESTDIFTGTFQRPCRRCAVGRALEYGRSSAALPKSATSDPWQLGHQNAHRNPAPERSRLLPPELPALGQVRLRPTVVIGVQSDQNDSDHQPLPRMNPPHAFRGAPSGRKIGSEQENIVSRINSEAVHHQHRSLQFDPANAGSVDAEHDRKSSRPRAVASVSGAVCPRLL